MNASLETRHYVATDADIERLAKDHIESVQGQAACQTTFLRSLFGTTIAELKAEPRSRSARERKAESAEVTKAQLDAFEAVYSRFYGVLVNALLQAPVNPETLPRWLSAKKATRKEIAQARATKFRTSAVALRGWLRAGFDITAVSPDNVTRSELEREARSVRKHHNGKEKASGLDKVARRATGAASKLVELVKEVAKFDPDRAAALISQAATVLAQARAEFAGTELSTTTTSLKKATESGAPLDFGKETFILLPIKPAARPALNG